MNTFEFIAFIGVIAMLTITGALVSNNNELLEESKARDAEIYRLEVCAEIRHNYLELDLDCPAIQPPEY